MTTLLSLSDLEHGNHILVEAPNNGRIVLDLQLLLQGLCVLPLLLRGGFLRRRCLGILSIDAHRILVLLGIGICL